MVHFQTVQKRVHVRVPRFHTAAALCVLLGGFAAGLGESRAGTSTSRDPAPRVVAVGDIHGALDGVREILRTADLIDPQGQWIGGRTILVQTGDFLDRGADAIQVAAFLRGLQKEADRAGGEAIILLGNHEAMNLIGDLRYVSAEEYAGFVDEKSEKRRSKAARKYADFLKRRAARLGQPRPDTDALEQDWLRRRPSGFVERMEVFSRGDWYHWLRKLPVAVRVADTVFMHGGLHPNLADWSLDRINDRVAKEIANFAKLKDRLAEEGLILEFFDLQEMEESIRLELDHARGAPFDLRRQERIDLMEDFLNTRSWLIRHPDGPLWFRGFATWTADDEVQLDELLSNHKAKRFVVGHNTTRSRRIESRFEGRIVLIDTGMLSAYYPGGGPSALEIDSRGATSLYPRELPLEAAVAGSPPN